METSSKEVDNAHTGETEYVTVGRKLRISLMKAGNEIKADFVVVDPVPFAEARPISKYLIEQFLSGDYDCVKVAFNDFKSTMVQLPKWFSFCRSSLARSVKSKTMKGVGTGDVHELTRQQHLRRVHLRTLS